MIRVVDCGVALQRSHTPNATPILLEPRLSHLDGRIDPQMLRVADKLAARVGVDRDLHRMNAAPSGFYSN